jgi:hypothetical protein
VLAARQHATVVVVGTDADAGTDPLTRSDDRDNDDDGDDTAEAEQHTLWTPRKRFQVPAERATVDAADILLQYLGGGGGGVSTTVVYACLDACLV